MLANCHQPLPEVLNSSETTRDNIADKNCYRKLGRLERYNMTSASDHIIQDYDLFTAPIKVPPSRNDHVSQQIRNKFGDYDSVARNIVHYPEDSISCLYDNNLKRKKNYNNNNNVVNFNVQNTNSNNIVLSQPTVKNGYDMVPVHYQSSVDNSPFVSKNTFSYKTNCNPNLNPNSNSNSKLCSGQKRDFVKEPTNITNEYPKLHSKPVKPLTKAPAVANTDINAKNSQIPKPETKNIKAIWNEMIDNRPPIKSIPTIPLKESVKPKDSNSSSSGQLDLKKPSSSIFDTPTPKSKKSNLSTSKKVPELDCMISLNEFIEFRPPISAIPSTPSAKEPTKSTKVSDLSLINNKLHEMIETRPPISAIPQTPAKESKKFELSTSNSSTSHAGSTSSVQKKNCRRLSSTRLSADLREDLRISDDSDDSDDNDEVAGLKKHDKTKSSDSAMQKTNSTKMTSSELPISSKTSLLKPVTKAPTSCSDSNSDSDSSSDDSDEDCQVPTLAVQLPPQPPIQPPQSNIKNEMECKPRWNLGSYLDKNLFPQNETVPATVTNPATNAQKTDNIKKEQTNSKKDNSKHSKSSSKMKSNKVILSSSSSSAESDKETKMEPSVSKSKKNPSKNKKSTSVKKIIDDSSDSDQDNRTSQHHMPNKVEKLEKKSRGRPRKRRSRFSSTSSSASSQSSADTDATFNSMRRLNSLSSERKYNRPVVTVRPLSPQQSSISSNSDDENRTKFNKKVTTNKTSVNNPYFQKPTDVGTHPPTTNNRKVYQKSNEVDSSKRQKTIKESATVPKPQPQLQMQPPNANRQDGPVYESRGGKSKQVTTKEQLRHSPVPVQNKITKKSQSKSDSIDNCKKIDYNDYDVKDQKKKFTLRKLFTPKKDSDGGKNGKGGKVGKVEIIVIDKKDSLNSINNTQESSVKNESSMVNNGSGSSIVCNIDLRQCISLPLSVMMKVSAEVIPCLPAMKDVVFDDISGPKHPHLNNMKRKRRDSESSSASLSSPADLPNNDLITDMKPPNKKINRINDVTNVQFAPNEMNLYPNNHDRFMGYHQAGNLDALRPIPNSYVAGPAHSYLNMNYHCEPPYQPAAAFPPFLMQPPVDMRPHYSYIDDVPNDLGHNKYFSDAMRLKHEATLIKDDTAQVMKFLESVLGFLIAGSALERDVTNDNTAAFTLYKETLDLIKNISKKIKWHKKMSPIQSKLAILSFRTQALLHLKLYQMQNFNCKEIQKTCNTFFKCNRFNPVPMDLNGHGLQISSPLSPNPSPCSSNSQSSGYASCNNDLKTGQCVMHSNSPMMPISRHTYNAFQKQNAIFYYLYSCHDLWNEADQMTYKLDHKDFFHGLDQAYRPLTLHSSLFELVHYVKAAIRVLKDVRS